MDKVEVPLAVVEAVGVAEVPGTLGKQQVERR